MAGMKLIDLLNDQEAQITVRDMVCSICWGNLAIHHAPDRMNSVLCRTCGENTRGYVSKSWAEHRRAEGQAELLEVKRAYPELAGEKETLAADEIDKQLGF